MTVLRLIKTLDVLGYIDNLTPMEQLFFKLHENLQEDDNNILWDETDNWIVYYDFRYQIFRYHYDRFYLVFNQKFDIDLQNFNVLCKYILVKHLNLKELAPAYNRY